MLVYEDGNRNNFEKGCELSGSYEIKTNEETHYLPFKKIYIWMKILRKICQAYHSGTFFSEKLYFNSFLFHFQTLKLIASCCFLSSTFCDLKRDISYFD